ncbi:translational elongation factor EF-1 alpha [Microbotryomycetes sp. JL221]|nr:translational elongation factor EF-1 alpha [Microbotryomycetes sp. JL221]
MPTQVMSVSKNTTPSGSLSSRARPPRSPPRKQSTSLPASKAPLGGLAPHLFNTHDVSISPSTADLSQVAGHVPNASLKPKTFKPYLSTALEARSHSIKDQLRNQALGHLLAVKTPSQQMAPVRTTWPLQLRGRHFPASSLRPPPLPNLHIFPNLPMSANLPKSPSTYPHPPAPAPTWLPPDLSRPDFSPTQPAEEPYNPRQELYRPSPPISGIRKPVTSLSQPKRRVHVSSNMNQSALTMWQANCRPKVVLLDRTSSMSAAFDERVYPRLVKSSPQIIRNLMSQYFQSVGDFDSHLTVICNPLTTAPANWREFRHVDIAVEHHPSTFLNRIETYDYLLITGATGLTSPDHIRSLLPTGKSVDVSRLKPDCWLLFTNQQNTVTPYKFRAAALSRMLLAKDVMTSSGPVSQAELKSAEAWIDKVNEQVKIRQDVAEKSRQLEKRRVVNHGTKKKRNVAKPTVANPIREQRTQIGHHEKYALMLHPHGYPIFAGVERRQTAHNASSRTKSFTFYLPTRAPNGDKWLQSDAKIKVMATSRYKPAKNEEGRLRIDPSTWSWTVAFGPNKTRPVLTNKSDTNLNNLCNLVKREKIKGSYKDLLPEQITQAFLCGSAMGNKIDAPKKVKKITSSEARKAKKERMARRKAGLPSDPEDEL